MDKNEVLIKKALKESLTRSKAVVSEVVSREIWKTEDIYIEAIKQVERILVEMKVIDEELSTT